MQAVCSSSGLTNRFVESLLAAASHPLPNHVAHAARLVVLDTLGAMLAAADPIWPGTRKMTDFVKGEGLGGECLVVGTSLRAAPTVAALANGYLGYALDIETHHGPAVMHAAAGVMPAALAIAETTGSSGKAFLGAVTLGIEVACRMSLAIGPNDLYARGFHPSAICGSFGAAAAGGLLLNLDAGRMANALGLAGTQSAGLLAWASDHNEESRPFNPGVAARNGVVAARFAALGFGAPQGICDENAKYNVFRAWSLDGHGLPDALLEGFNQRFAVQDLTYKFYACCAFLHPALDALLSIMQANELQAVDLAEIVMRFPSSGAPIIDGNPLRSHRAQYILPLAATRRAVHFEDVLYDRSDDPDMQRLAAATWVLHDDELDQDYPRCYTTVLTAITVDGHTFQQRIEWPIGSPQNPVSDHALTDKFLRLTEARLGRVRSEEIAQLAVEIDQRGRFATLIKRLEVADENEMAGSPSLS